MMEEIKEIKKLKQIYINNIIFIFLIQIGIIQGYIGILLTAKSPVIFTTISFILYFTLLFLNDLFGFILLKNQNLSILKEKVIKTFWICLNAYIIVITLLLFFFY